jgi:hypothetical protein
VHEAGDTERRAGRLRRRNHVNAMLNSQEAPHSCANVDESKPQTEGSCIRTLIRVKSKGVAPST